MKRAVARRFFCGFAAGLAALANVAMAQGTYPAPSSAVRLVYGYAAGGGGDVIARLLAAKVSTQMNANMFVDNRPGNSAHVGNEFAAKSKPDGYTLLFNDASVVLGPALGEKIGYDPFKDLVPVSFVAPTQFALVVHSSVPSNTVGEFLSYLRTNTGKTAYGSAGVGTMNHLGGALFLQINNLTSLHVPYKGGGLMMLDVAAGRVQWAITTLVTIIPLEKEKRVKTIAFAGQRRSALRPDVPTFAESGMPGFEVGNWYAVMAPAQTPPAVVKFLSDEIRKALQDQNLRARMEEQAAEPRGSTPEEYGAYLKGEFERWSKVVKAANITRE